MYGSVREDRRNGFYILLGLIGVTVAVTGFLPGSTPGRKRPGTS